LNKLFEEIYKGNQLKESRYQFLETDYLGEVNEYTAKTELQLLEYVKDFIESSKASSGPTEFTVKRI